MDLSVIICTYNRSRDLARVLSQISDQQVEAPVTWDVHVIDNNSTDDTKDIVLSAGQGSQIPIHYLLESRQGKSYAMNTGVDRSTGAIVLFTDDDVVLTPDWVKETIRFFERFDCAGMGGKVIPDFEGGLPPWLDADRPFPLKFDFGETPQKIGAPPFGCNMAYRREVFDTLGRFRTDLGPGVSGGNGLGEDSEFGMRVLNAGYEIMYSPTAVIHHPIEPERASRKYLIDWYYRYGRSLVLRGEVPSDSPMLGNVPRYLFRILVENVFKWFFNLSPKSRFYNRLAVARIMGTIVQVREDAVRSKAMASNGEVEA